MTIRDLIFAEDVESGVSEEECRALAELAAERRVLEVGSWLGRSTIAMASRASIVHAVDWHRGDPHSSYCATLTTFRENLVRYDVLDRVVIHVGLNQDVLPAFAPGLFDLIFLDSFHERSAVERDISLLRPLLRKGGTIAFHDYGRTLSYAGIPFGVTEAVDAFLAKEDLTFRVMESLAIVGTE